MTFSLSVDPSPFCPRIRLCPAAFMCFLPLYQCCPSWSSFDFDCFSLPCPNSFVNDFRDKGHWSRGVKSWVGKPFQFAKSLTKMEKGTLQWQNLLFCIINFWRLAIHSLSSFPKAMILRLIGRTNERASEQSSVIVIIIIMIFFCVKWAN